jgi:hypothetical protein
VKLQSDVGEGMEKLQTALSDNLASDVHNAIRQILPDTSIAGFELNGSNDVRTIIHLEVESVNTAAAATQRTAAEMTTAVDALRSSYLTLNQPADRSGAPLPATTDRWPEGHQSRPVPDLWTLD